MAELPIRQGGAGTCVGSVGSGLHTLETKPVVFQSSHADCKEKAH